MPIGQIAGGRRKNGEKVAFIRKESKVGYGCGGASFARAHHSSNSKLWDLLFSMVCANSG
jgi:hypothetical protein